MTTKPTATEAFLAYKSRLDAALAEIQSASDDHFDTNPDDLNWGHVGWLANLVRETEAIAEQAAMRGEYAP